MSETCRTATDPGPGLADNRTGAPPGSADGDPKPLGSATAPPPFAPTRTELLRRATAEAEEIVGRALADAGTQVRQAEADAAEIAARARAVGAAQAAARAAAGARHARLAERSAMLSARRAAYDRWRDTARAAVLALRAEPGFDRVQAELRAAAVRLLGSGARLTEDPLGGLVAAADGRRLDLRLTTIAARALEDSEPEIERLWT